MSDAKTIALIKALGGGGGGGGGSSFDPDISNPQDGQVLVYDGTAGKWVNGSGGGGDSSVFLITVTQNESTFTLNKTAQEIYNAMSSNKLCLIIGTTEPPALTTISYYFIEHAEVNDGTYSFYTIGADDPYVADTANDYPQYNSSL